MQQAHHRFALAALALGWILLAPPLAGAAEIYRWVDDKGNVHFGDKPRDPAQAAEAENVEVNEAYRPPERSDEELQEMRDASEANWNRARELRREEQAEAERERTEREQRLAEVCGELDAEIQRFSGIRVVDGQRVLTAGLHSDGRVATEEEQQAHVEQLRQYAAQLGCPGY
ncbi:DUF4124 domain-containing protein [Mangrovimicrobium sediminis]|uniref:DUF4124 domain-containing protein n=1 Tax=Mangrovimicrobium sediminis TaxID=2562682 RepID=A0A4Z0M3I9_9GAMM|nr:DUF4124 domain-containing protein [Haliea sp. SAOS-164]TGD73865.1 DUF4124 domain-containing protein [Haliea sp. SAOS-164]